MIATFYRILDKIHSLINTDAVAWIYCNDGSFGASMLGELLPSSELDPRGRPFG